MSGIWLQPHTLADTLAETVGYKSGLALRMDEICDHLEGTDYPDLILKSEQHLIRIRPEEYEDLFYELLYAVGYTAEKFDGDYAGVKLFRKYEKTHYDEFEAISVLFVEMMPQLIDEAAQKGTKSIDPTAFLKACRDKLGALGLQIGLEWVQHMAKSLAMSPYSHMRYIEWRGTRELSALFRGGKEEPEFGRFIDQRFINYLSNNPIKIESMHWRKFEELTAEFFARAGFQVQLGPGQNDDGVDIRVWRADQSIETQPPHCIIQCKRQKNKVDKVIIKGLYSDVQFEDADYGLIVTSSELSPGARETISVRGYPIREVNRDSVAEWCAKLRTPGTGIVRV